MSHRIDDRWLWLSVGLGLIIAFKGIKYAITDTVRLTQVKPLGKDQDEELQRQPEDCMTPHNHLTMRSLTPHRSDPSRCPPHPHHLSQPQHKQMRLRHRPIPLRKKPQPRRENPSRRNIL